MPRLTQSDIITDLAQVMEKQGLLKTAYPSLEAYQDDAEARLGSDTISNIEALYGVKPEQIESLEYEHTITEVAHPNSVVITPSYDKINGLVENDLERAHIMHNLVLGPVSGNHSNPKYAKQELVMELVRLANELDVRNQQELCQLADDCLGDLTKEAAVPIAVGVVAAIAAVLAATWLISHTDNADLGPSNNIDVAIKALENLKTTSWHESEVDNTVKEECDKLINHLKHLKSSVEKFNQISGVLYKPRTLSEMQELLKVKEVADQHGAQIASAVEEFRKEVRELDPLISASIDNFSDTFYQQQHTHSSDVSKWMGWAGEALHGRWGLVPNDFVSAVNALKPLRTSLDEMIGRIDKFERATAVFAKKIEATNAKYEKKLEEKKDKVLEGKSDEHTAINYMLGR